LPETSAPQHVAIIMDGNRRWASLRSRSATFGHEKGSSVVEGIARHAYDEGVSWLTLFAFSSENWRRSPVELRGLFGVLERYLKTKIHTLMQHNIKLRIIGDMTGFSAAIIQLLQKAVAETSGNDGLNLTIALGFGGQVDITRAARRLAELARDGVVDPAMIDADMLKSHLDTSELPPVDLLIRTGGEQRVSNFLLWDLAYAELAFTDTLWPDFSPEELSVLLADYAGRSRRFGGDDKIEIQPAKAVSS